MNFNNGLPNGYDPRMQGTYNSGSNDYIPPQGYPTPQQQPEKKKKKGGLVKKAAAAAGEKAISMIPQKQLLPLTGYVHGGCSPVNMKKTFPTYLHRTAEGMERIFVSAGKVGAQVEVAPADLQKLTGFEYADLV